MEASEFDKALDEANAKEKALRDAHDTAVKTMGMSLGGNKMSRAMKAIEVAEKEYGLACVRLHQALK